MKYLLILLFPSIVFCQENNFQSSKDTIYIVLNTTEKLKCNGFTYMSWCRSNHCEYSFHQNEKQILFFHVWKDYKTLFLNRKEFFEENKNQIYYITDIEKIGISNLMKIIFDNQRLKKRVVYIINEEDIKRKQFFALEAAVAPVGYGDM